MGKSYSHLSLEQRCKIASLHEAGQSCTKIASNLGCSPSTISRELKRNSGTQVGYKPVWAGDLAWARRWRGFGGVWGIKPLGPGDPQAWP